MANNRKIFVINPDFQYKFCLIICSLVFLGSLFYPFTIYDIFERLIQTQATSGNAAELAEQRTNLLILLTVAQTAFLAIIFVLCIFISHKIAGPMYKLKKYLSEVRTGESNYPLNFRTGDYFSEVAEEVNQTLDFLVDKNEEELEYLNEISVYIENISLVVPEDKKPVIEEIQAKLAKYQELRTSR